MLNSWSSVAALAGMPRRFMRPTSGMQVTLVDTEPNPGGVCLYRGCIPSKALLHVAKVVERSEARDDTGA